MGVSRETEGLTERVIGAAIEVHRGLGPGYRESLYHKAMKVELDRRGLGYRSEWPVAVSYKGVEIGAGKLDFLIEDQLVLELKAVERLHPVHEAQVLHYLKAANLPLALILNFRAPLMKQGIKRLIQTTQPR